MSNWIPEVELGNIEGDFENFDFSKILKQEKHTANLLYFLGGTLSNIENRLNVLTKIITSLDIDDMLIINFTIGKDAISNDYSWTEFENFEGILLKELGIDLSLCKLNKYFDAHKQKFLTTITLDKDYCLQIDSNGLRTSVDLPKNKDLTIWMHLLSNFQDIIKLIEDSGGSMFNATKSLDETQGMFFIKRKIK